LRYSLLADDDDLSTLPTKISVDFDRKVEAASFNDDGTSAVVLTRDGRLWHVSIEEERRRLNQKDHSVRELVIGKQIVGANILENCKGFSDDEKIEAWLVAGSSLSPPCLVVTAWQAEGQQLDSQAQDIAGLEHVRDPVTTMLFVTKHEFSDDGWKNLVGDSNHYCRSVILLGFANGAIRMCTIDERGHVGAMQMLGYVGQSDSNVFAILAVPKRALLAINSRGVVNVVARSSSGSFRRVDPGLPSGQAWTSAAVIGGSADVRQTLLGHSRNGLVATSIDGATHALLLMDDTLDGDIGSVSFSLSVRKDAAFAATYLDSGQNCTWMAVNTRSGGLVLMRVQSLRKHMEGSSVGPLQQSIGNTTKRSQEAGSESERILSLLSDFKHAKGSSIDSLAGSPDRLAILTKEAGELTTATVDSLRGSRQAPHRVVVEQNGDCYMAKTTVVGRASSWNTSLHMLLQPNTMSLSILDSASHSVAEGGVAFFGSAVSVSTSMASNDKQRRQLQASTTSRDCSLGRAFVSLTSKCDGVNHASKKRRLEEDAARLGIEDKDSGSLSFIVPIPTRMHRSNEETS
jgi:hypothetical protein